MADSAWSNTTLRERLAWVRGFRRHVAAAERELCELAELETGKPRAETLPSDLGPLLASCVWHERHARRVLAPRRVGGRPIWMLGMRHRIERAPMGRVAIIATWNYPYNLLGQQLIAALVGGNRVIVKPSERCPEAQRCLLELASEGLPPGTLEVWGHDREAGARLVGEGAIDHLVFTGSTEVGRSIAERLGKRLVPSSLELSGRDSAIVLDDADAKLAAKTIWFALTLNRGQTCMAPRRALVTRAAYDEFVREIEGLAKDAEPVELIDAGSTERVRGLISAAVGAGGRAVPGREDGRLRPTAVVDCPPDAALVEGRHFGPAIAVLPVEDEAEAIRVHRSCDQHLAASVFTRRPGRHRDLVARLGATCVTFNDCVIPTAHPATPIGGIGPSGWGLTQGAEGLLKMTRPVVVSTTSSRVRLPAEPLEAKRVEQLAGFLRRRYGR
ncbi:MAG: aldehyde dehydrogenase family protein [Planctomycetota bacterium]